MDDEIIYAVKWEAILDFSKTCGCSGVIFVVCGVFFVFFFVVFLQVK